MTDSSSAPGRASTLFVAGGSDAMERVYRSRHVGYWSAAFDVLLEAHGWLDFDKGGPGCLEDPQLLRRYDLVIVAWLPDWEASWLRSLRSYDGVVFLEGPIPPLLESFAGITHVPGRAERTRGRLRLPAGSRLASEATQGGTVFELCPPAPGSSEATCEDSVAGAERTVGEIAASYAAAYAARFQRNGAVFPEDPGSDGLAALAFALYVRKLAPDVDRVDAVALAGRMLSRSNVRPSRSVHMRRRRLEGDALRAAGLHALGIEFDAALHHAPEPFASVSGRFPLGQTSARRLAAARAYAAARRGGQGVARQLASAAATGSQPGPRDAVRLWFLEGVRTAIGEEGNEFDVDAARWLNDLANALSDTNGRLPASLDGWQVVQLMPLVGVLQQRGSHEAAAVLLRHVLEQCMDVESGRLWSGEVEGGELHRGSIRTTAPDALLGLLDFVRQTPALPDLNAGSERPRDHQEIAAASPLRLDSYRNMAGEDVLALEGACGLEAGVVRRGRILSSSFSLLGFLVHVRAMSGRDRLAFPGPCTAGLEAALFRTLDQQLERYGLATLHLAPGAGYARSDAVPSDARAGKAESTDVHSGSHPLARRPVLSDSGIVQIEAVSPSEQLADQPAQLRVLRVRRLQNTRELCSYEVSSPTAIDDLQLRFISTMGPVGSVDAGGAEMDISPVLPATTVRIRLSVPAGRPVELRLYRPRAPRYEELFPLIAAKLKRRIPGYVPDDLHARVSNLTEIINRFTPFRDLTHARIGDVGCGYGPFPLALSLSERPQHVLGIDVSAASMRTASGFGRDADVRDVRFVQGSVLDVDKAASKLDLLLVINVLVYLTRRDQAKAARACHAALRPGGAMIAMVSNRLHRIDAFTELPWVHRLPRRVAHHYVRLRGLRSGYLDVRSPSPQELLRAYERAGFASVQLIDPERVLVIDRPRRYRDARFYLVAIKAAEL